MNTSNIVCFHYIPNLDGKIFFETTIYVLVLGVDDFQLWKIIDTIIPLRESLSRPRKPITLKSFLCCGVIYQ